MAAIPPRRGPRRYRRARGFSLIELGIVIAVIAVLAAVVIYGRGFIAASRVTKAVEGMDTIRKSASTFAGLQGGSLSGITGPQLPVLSARSLLPALSAGNVWTVSGTASAPDSVSISDVRFGQLLNTQGQPTNVVAIQVQTPLGTMPQDVWTAVSTDSSLYRGGLGVDGFVCGTALPAVSADHVIICFFL